MAERARNDRRERVMPEIVLRNDSTFICENELKKWKECPISRVVCEKWGFSKKFRREELLPGEAYDPKNWT
jgi:hypothetical protein